MRGTRPLTTEELAKVLTAAPSPRDRALLAVCANTGTRISEALALTVGDVRGKAELALARANTKGKRTGRVVPMNATVRAECAAFLATRPEAVDADPLFPSRKGSGSLTRGQAWRGVKVAALAAGIDPSRVATHSFRKTFATRLDRAGVRLAVLRDLLGHSSISVTEAYLATTASEAAAAVALL